ncbi:MAG: MFS transporter [Alphaproteobacteria bacterium]
MTGNEFARRQQRVGKVPTSIRFWQAIGAWPNTFKDIAFNTFLLFYYSQLLGMPATMASIALAIALAVDAISDPLVGSFSDNLKSAKGRRHPLMYWAAAPLGFFLWLIFMPPAGLDDWGLFAWLLGTVMGARLALTFFSVPWNALFSEFTDDYDERTQIITWRWAIGWGGGLAFGWVGMTFIFPSSDTYEFGQFNIGAYPLYGAVLGIAVALSAFATTYMTRKEVPYLYENKSADTFGLRNAAREIGLALRNRNFLRLFLSIFIGAMVVGTNEALSLFMNTYFWGLRPEDLRWFGFAIIGAVIAFAAVPTIQLRFDKKTIIVFVIAFLVLNGMAIVSLRLLDVLPPNGSSALLWILVVNTTLRAGLATAMGIIFGSMVADVLDDQQLKTGKRQEGVFNAALSFSGKLTSGFGVIVGGLVLDYVVKIPSATDPSAVDPNAVLRLGVTDALIVPLFLLPILWWMGNYRITRARQQEIRQALDARGTQDKTDDPAA